jgi:hypothetical protein
MSMEVDIQNAILKAHKNYMLNEDQAVELYVDIAGALAWGFDNVNYEHTDWVEQERAVAHVKLFGEVE